MRQVVITRSPLQMPTMSKSAEHCDFRCCAICCCSGKTVDEVWAAIKRNQADVRQLQSDHFTVGGLLEGIGVIPGEEGAAGGPMLCAAVARGALC